jgi:hypothetical protein
VTDLEFLKEYSGESSDELLGYEGRYRIDSLVLAFEQAIQAKKGREHRLAPEEEVVLAVEAMERQVNNGGWDQFFRNSSKTYAPILVDALVQIGCANCARITRDAIAALCIDGDLTEEAIDRVMAEDSAARDERLDQCDEAYYANREDIGGRLFEFLKANRHRLRLA